MHHKVNKETVKFKSFFFDLRYDFTVFENPSNSLIINYFHQKLNPNSPKSKIRKIRILNLGALGFNYQNWEIEVRHFLAILNSVDFDVCCLV